MRHNEVRNLLASCCSYAGFKGVECEPSFLPLSEAQKKSGFFDKRTAITDDGARADLSALGFWTDMGKTFFDVRVFNPNAPTYQSKTPKALYQQHELEKKREYNQRTIEVEKATFTPLVFSTFGGAGPECTMALKRLAEQIADRRHQCLSSIMGWLRTRLCFSLLRSSINCLRGSRVSPKHPPGLEFLNFEIGEAGGHFQSFSD